MRTNEEMPSQGTAVEVGVEVHEVEGEAADRRDPGKTHKLQNVQHFKRSATSTVLVSYLCHNFLCRREFTESKSTFGNGPHIDTWTNETADTKQESGSFGSKFSIKLDPHKKLYSRHSELQLLCSLCIKCCCSFAAWGDMTDDEYTGSVRILFSEFSFMK